MSDDDASAEGSVLTAIVPPRRPRPPALMESSLLKGKTRQSAAVFGVGSGITKDDENITGSRLPTNSQVLRCLMYHIDDGLNLNRPKWESAKLVLAKIASFYEKASIPMISERKCCEKLLKLLDDNAKIRAIPLKRRSTPASQKKVKEMEDRLTLTFPLWPTNAESVMKNTEDIQFLQSMKSDRLATFGSHDKVLAAKLKRRHERDMSMIARREKNRTQMNNSMSLLTKSDSDSDDRGLAKIVMSS